MVGGRHLLLRSTWVKAGEVHSAHSLLWFFLQKSGNKVKTYKMFIILVIALVRVCL